MKNKKYTLERHLHKLAELDEGNKSLESVYDLQKRKLERYMSSVLTTFPTYSTHDALHSVNIIASIEKILGKSRIKALSAIDTFLILMCAYMHDIGMLYTDKEVRTIWDSVPFQDFLKNCESGNGDVSHAARLVMGKVKDGKTEEPWPLEVRQSVTIVLMEYFRPRHGKRIEQFNTPGGDNGIAGLLRIEDSFLPIRLIKMINRISMAHTAGFEQMLETLTRTDSFNGEEFHPRMIAFLLRMGDLCDLDNTRFNRVAIAAFGTLKDENLAHYFKHRSVETLLISEDEIRIVADVRKEDIAQTCRMEWEICEDARVDGIFEQTIREHINWKTWMEQELRDARLNVQELFPKSWNFKLPELIYQIKINGQSSVSSNENLKFQFSAEKAYSLIENISIYNDEKFIFVRELIQNAIDATKIQLWRELRTNGGEEAAKLTPFEVEEQFPGIFERYQIGIQLHYKEETETFSFQIQDKGIGISLSDLKENILQTASSWGKRAAYKEEIRQMPKWLQPTGAFGIGMHTVFSVTDQMKIFTKSEREAWANEITLHSGKKDGYVFCQKAETPTERGTCFSFEFPLTEELREQFYKGDENEFLKDSSSDWEWVLINEIEKYCCTPLFPIYINEMPVVPALVESTWVNEIGIRERKNKILEEEVSDPDYTFAFGYDYSYVVLYDKKRNVVMNIGINQSVQSGVRFMGMQVERALELPDCEGQNLCVEYLDILAGNTEEMIDAGRSGLTYRAVTQMQQAVEEALLFARKIYFKLMKAVCEDGTVCALRQEFESLAEAYEKGILDERMLWRKVCDLKKKYAGETDSRQVRSLACRITSRMLALQMADFLLLRQIRNLEPLVGRDPYEATKNLDITAFHFLDYLLVTWKADWKGTGEYFYREYFDKQISEVVEHYLVLWGIFCYANYWSSIPVDVTKQYVHKVELLVEGKYRRMFPRMSNWNKTGHLAEIASELMLQKVRLYLYKTDEPFAHLLLPASAMVFPEWNYKAEYTKNPALSLMLAAPYGRLLYDCLDCRIPKTPEMVQIWANCIRKTLYGEMSEDCETDRKFKHLLNDGQVFLWRRYGHIESECLPAGLMQVINVEKKSGLWRISMSPMQEPEFGIVATEDTKEDAFCTFWRYVEQSSDKNTTGYQDIVGFREYEPIVLRKRGYCEWLHLSCTYDYIPAWDYLYAIKTYLNDFRCNEEQEKCVEGILAAPKTERAIRYIAKQKCVEKQPEKVAEISECYGKLVSDMVKVWFEQMPRG